MKNLALDEKLARTRAAYDELAEIWDDRMPMVVLHDRSHIELHESGEQASAFASAESWYLAITIGDYPFGPRLYGLLDHACDECRALWRSAMQAHEGRERFEALL